MSPIQFIPLVEDLGLIGPFTDIILQLACQACSTWPNDIRVSVNLSASHFQRGDVAGAVQAALNESGLAPDRLELEITESLLLDSRSETMATINALREIGARIVLDDFGTGFSSFAYLLEFPIDKVKIDRSFAANLESNDRARTLVDSLAQMIRRLGMSVTMEGVETIGQLDMLKAFGSIDEIQGYFFSRPVPEDQVAGLLLKSARTAFEPNVVSFAKPSAARA